MREIKFRAWDTNTIKSGFMLYCDNFKHIAIDTFLNSDNRMVMQYTGLHDTNDIEIYESDIVYRETLSSDDICCGYYGDIGTVVFEYGSFMIDWGDISELLYDIHLNAVVKGNVYENPDLI